VRRICFSGDPKTSDETPVQKKRNQNSGLVRWKEDPGKGGAGTKVLVCKLTGKECGSTHSPMGK